MTVYLVAGQGVKIEQNEQVSWSTSHDVRRSSEGKVLWAAAGLEAAPNLSVFIPLTIDCNLSLHLLPVDCIAKSFIWSWWIPWFPWFVGPCPETSLECFQSFILIMRLSNPSLCFWWLCRKMTQHGLLQGDTCDTSIKFITILFLCRLVSLTQLLGKMQPATSFALLVPHEVSLGK